MNLTIEIEETRLTGACKICALKAAVCVLVLAIVAVLIWCQYV